MDIVIGSTQAPVWRKKASPPPGSLNVDAKLLAIRPPRKKRNPVPDGGQKRKALQHQSDPLSGQVLILMVPDKRSLPRGLDEGRYKVRLQFVPVTSED